MTDDRRRIDAALRLIGWGGAAVLLLIPLLAMRFTDEVNWTGFDFLFAGALLLGAGLLMELAFWKASGWAYRFGVGAAAGAALALVVATGAVGVIGAEDDPANRAFVAVLATAVGGAAVARLRARGMAVAMAAAAAVQASVGAGAVVMGLGQEGPAWPADIIGATALFCLLWLTSAGLFLAASRPRTVTT